MERCLDEHRDDFTITLFLHTFGYVQKWILERLKTYKNNLKFATRN
jgi:hypothetical protein